jgi:hypothetical protein
MAVTELSLDHYKGMRPGAAVIIFKRAKMVAVYTKTGQGFFTVSG